MNEKTFLKLGDLINKLGKAVYENNVILKNKMIAEVQHEMLEMREDFLNEEFEKVNKALDDLLKGLGIGA